MDERNEPRYGDGKDKAPKLISGQGEKWDREERLHASPDLLRELAQVDPPLDSHL